jgi:ribonuclease P protein component
MVRLKSKNSIDFLFSKGTYLKEGPLKLVYFKEKKGDVAIGFGVSKRLFARAVDRNKIKRLMREQCRGFFLKINSDRFLGSSFFIYEGTELPGFDGLKKPMGILIKLWGAGD